MNYSDRLNRVIPGGAHTYSRGDDQFLKKRTICHKKTEAYIVPKWKSPEIDDIWDFICIEAIMKYRQENAEVGNE